MAINVSKNNPRVVYSVSSTPQTNFVVPFDFFETDDLNVYVDGTLQTHGSDYTLSGPDADQSPIIFAVAVSNCEVAITRDVPLERTTDFSTSVGASALNDQLDRIVAQIADIDDKASRALQLNDYDAAVSLALPSLNAIKGKVLAFDPTTGEPIAGPASNDIATIATNISAIIASEGNAASAIASKNAAAASESAAAASASNAAASATNSASSASAAAASETASAASKAAAAISEANAATSEANAAASEASVFTNATNAASSATSAATSATSASTSATNAALSEANAATSATSASSSASSASSSATAAASSASAASASKTAAEASETAAAASQVAAAISESNAASSASSALSSASAAASSASAASASADAALTALDSFDDRYLGQKASDPSVDNDGDALVSGALYYNTTDSIMKVYDGSLWVAAYASLSGAMFGSNNLSDVSDVAASRNNLGLGTAATTASTDYATSAQGALADSAVQPASLATVATTGAYADLSGLPTLGTAAATSSADYATAAQGALADTAIQPADLAAVATTGSYSDLSGLPTLGTAAATASTDYATAAQGSLADSAVQPNDNPTFGIANVTSIDFGAWTITESAGVLYFASNGTNKLKIDASGNLTVSGNVTAYGSV